MISLNAPAPRRHRTPNVFWPNLMSQPSYPALKSLSQNFLRNETQARHLVDRLPLTPLDRVVELGAGRGAMTFLLAEKVSRVLAVEIDAGHSTELQARVSETGRKNIEVLHEDLLKTDWEEWFRILGGPFSVVGNLPYHISTPILFKIIENRPIIKAAYVMLQKEVADRLLARSGNKRIWGDHHSDRLLCPNTIDNAAQTRLLLSETQGFFDFCRNQLSPRIDPKD